MKATAIVLGIIIIILLGVLVFVKPVSEPTGQPFQVDLPHANDVVSSPVAIEGSVTGGGWFFEASFPIKILDGDGRVIGQGSAQALSDWMSTGTVPFSASIPFTTPHYATGTIVFVADNPSGAPQNEKSMHVPIMFAAHEVVPANTGTVQGHVVVGPTCPVESIPPNPQCAPRPYATSISIMRGMGSQIIETIETDASGDFAVSLPMGDYTFQPKSGSPFPRCNAETVAVTAGKEQAVMLGCDTGIR